MTTAIELRALADRVMKLRGPCRETDAEVRAITATDAHYVASARASSSLGKVVVYYHDGAHGTQLAPDYTRSLDAAVALVPDQWQWCAAWERPLNGGAWADVRPNHIGIEKVKAATPALAFTAAALLARARMMEDGE